MRIAVCGNYGASNIGDELILESLKRLIKEAQPNSEVIVMGRGLHLPVGIRSFFRSLFNRTLWKRPFEAIKSCNAFILGGGGLFSDEEGLFIPFFWVVHGLTAMWCGKPVYCLGISVGSVNWINALLLKWFFKKVKLITVRDENSKKLLAKWGIQSENLSDLAFVLDVEQYKYVPTTEKYVVLSIRRFKKDDAVLYKKIARACDLIIEKYGLNIKLMPFEKGMQFDEGVLNKIFELCEHKSNIKAIAHTTQLNELVNIFRDAKIVVGMRLHSCILAAMCGTPFIPLNYMKKVSDFWTDFSEIQSVKLKNLNVDELLRHFDFILKNYPRFKEITAKIKQILTKKAQKTKELTALICR